MKIRTLVFLMLSAVLAALPAHAQNTTVNFDSPACSGNGVKIYQGIDFSASPWDCEQPSIPGDDTTMLSWYSQINSGTFKFLSPSVLVSITLGTSSSGNGGTFTISTDAGESLTQAVTKDSIVNLTTNFRKLASVVTVTFTGGWTIELDNIIYSTIPPAPPISLTVSGTARFDDGTPILPNAAANVMQLQNGTAVAIGQISSDASGNITGSVIVDPRYTVNGLVAVSLTISGIAAPGSLTLDPRELQQGSTGLTLQIVLYKAVGLPKSATLALTP